MKALFITYMIIAVIVDLYVCFKLDGLVRRMLGLRSTYGSSTYQEDALSAGFAFLSGGFSGLGSWVANVVLRCLFGAVFAAAMVVEALVGALLFHVPLGQIF